MKLISESSDFDTVRNINFKGKDGDVCGGSVTLKISARGITTEDMVKQLEGLATDVAICIKKIIAAQEAPQQFFKTNEGSLVDEWLSLQKGYQQVVGDTASKSE